MSIEDHLQEAISKFNQKAATDEKLRSELAGVERTVLIKLDDGRAFNFDVRNGKAGDLRIGSAGNAQIIIESNERTLEALFKKEIRVMKAYATKKLRIKASLEDMLRLRKFF